MKLHTLKPPIKPTASVSSKRKVSSASLPRTGTACLSGTRNSTCVSAFAEGGAFKLLHIGFFFLLRNFIGAAALVAVFVTVVATPLAVFLTARPVLRKAHWLALCGFVKLAKQVHCLLSFFTFCSCFLTSSCSLSVLYVLFVPAVYVARGETRSPSLSVSYGVGVVGQGIQLAGAVRLTSSLNGLSNISSATGTNIDAITASFSVSTAELLSAFSLS
mmetsp:Transcript_103695/g.203369  ORF Transcript_103695/g.203369 Transcript_103695/m.203369 type:complete len:217 (+) Transcript_103695:195-845(+)